jgi:ligand-binding SRPBCC domain-containing protein
MERSVETVGPGPYSGGASRDAACFTQHVPTFDFTFTVDAPFAAVSAFHHDSTALKKLTPPPMFVQIHSMEPLAEGSITKFTVWAGPLPIRWTAEHSDVSDSGFTDTQAEGPMARWVHTHRYIPIDDTTTKVTEHIEYEFGSGKDRLVGLLAFSKPALLGLFNYRKLRTRWDLRKA